MKLIRPIGIISLIAIVVLTISSIAPTQPNPSLAETDIENFDVDLSCVIDCEFTGDFLTLSEIIIELPESNDSLLIQALDNLIEFSIQEIIIKRTLGDSTVIISQLDLTKSLAFITTEGSFDDLTAKNLSYTFEISADSEVKFGSVLIETLVNGEPVAENRYSFTGIPTDGKLKITTDKLPVGKIISKAVDGQVIVELNIKEFFVRSDLNEDLFAILMPVKIHTLTVEKDTNKIIYKNEQGKSVKIYPTDDKLKISSDPSNLVYGGSSCLSSTKGRCNTYSISGPSFDPNPPVGAITVFDENGNVVASSDSFGGSAILVSYDCGRSCSARTVYPVNLIDIDIQRGSQYTVKIGSPNNVEFTIDTPKSQKNYSFKCIKSGCNFP